LTEKTFDWGSPSTRQNRFRRSSVMVLRSINGKKGKGKK
jgi:hypothetical protein